MIKFSHLDKDGMVRMVDVTHKPVSVRHAQAYAVVTMSSETIRLIEEDSVPKGNVFTTAKIAGIQAAKSTSQLIPLCHPLQITHADVTFDINPSSVHITTHVSARDATGIEMEALTAAAAAALTIYDMCKAVDKSMVIKNITLIKKTGGESDSGSEYRPVTGILVLSDRISKGIGEDKSGKILKTGFSDAGCKISRFEIIPDDPVKIKDIINQWCRSGVELIITSGGTGLSPRDITVQTIEPLFDKKLPGIENVLHRFGQENTRRAMLSRLTAGTIGSSVVICLPGSSGAAKDAVQVLIPAVFHAFDMIRGKSHKE